MRFIIHSKYLFLAICIFWGSSSCLGGKKELEEELGISIEDARTALASCDEGVDSNGEKFIAIYQRMLTGYETPDVSTKYLRCTRRELLEALENATEFLTSRVPSYYKKYEKDISRKIQAGKLSNPESFFKMVRVLSRSQPLSSINWDPIADQPFDISKVHENYRPVARDYAAYVDIYKAYKLSGYNFEKYLGLLREAGFETNAYKSLANEAKKPKKIFPEALTASCVTHRVGDMILILQNYARFLKGNVKVELIIILNKYNHDLKLVEKQILDFKRKHPKSDIRLISDKRDLSLGKADMVGVQEAKNPIIMKMDADDLYGRMYPEDIVSAFNTHDCKLVGSWVQFTYLGHTNGLTLYPFRMPAFRKRGVDPTTLSQSGVFSLDKKGAFPCGARMSYLKSCVDGIDVHFGDLDKSDDATLWTTFSKKYGTESVQNTTPFNGICLRNADRGHHSSGHPGAAHNVWPDPEVLFSSIFFNIHSQHP